VKALRYSAVIFDMDGTLTDNLDHAARAYRESFSHYTGRSWTNDELFALFGPNCEGICQKAVPDKWEEVIEMFYQILDETYDMQAAREAGVMSIRAAWGKSASLFEDSAEGPQPDITFRAVSEFTAWLSTWD
jgi:phosphoglycolate phosphatase-like HAD superfamily hydrolase